MGWTCFQGKYWTASSSWYFSISLPISFSISTIVNQLCVCVCAVNSLTSTCCALNHLPGVMGLGWDQVPSVNEVTFSPGCLQYIPMLAVSYKIVFKLLRIHDFGRWLNGIWGLFSNLCCILSLKSHFLLSTFFFSEYFSAIGNTSVLAAIACNNSRSCVFRVVLFISSVPWLNTFEGALMKLFPTIWAKRSSSNGVCR